MNQPKKRGPKFGRRASAPVNPERVRKIVRLRDKGLTYKEVADKLAEEEGVELTSMAVFSAYFRWREWVWTGFYK